MARGGAAGIALQWEGASCAPHVPDAAPPWGFSCARRYAMCRRWGGGRAPIGANLAILDGWRQCPQREDPPPQPPLPAARPPARERGSPPNVLLLKDFG